MSRPAIRACVRLTAGLSVHSLLSAAFQGMTTEKCVLLTPPFQAAESSLSNAAHTARSAGCWLVLSDVDVRLARELFVELEIVSGT